MINYLICRLGVGDVNGANANMQFIIMAKYLPPARDDVHAYHSKRPSVRLRAR